MRPSRKTTINAGQETSELVIVTEEGDLIACLIYIPD